jgi:hypothetical protein
MASGGFRRLLILAVAGLPAATSAGPAARLHQMNKEMADTVTIALVGAARRLARADCADLLHQFTDADGRPLADGLHRLQTDGPGYLGLVMFSGGQHQVSCHRRRALAFTSPGSRVVYVCPDFAPTQRKDPAFAEFVIIHEALHSLGLGENPPSSAEITARVADRCRL